MLLQMYLSSIQQSRVAESGRPKLVLLSTTRAPIESTIATDLYVNDTAMFSRGRNHVGILIEPRAGHEIDVDDETRLGEFRNGVCDGQM